MNFGNLSFRARLTLVAAAAVALAVVLASVVVWLVVRSQLRSQVDNDLRTRSAEISSGGPLHLEQFPDGHIYLDVHRDVLAGGGFVQLVGPNGKTYRTPDESGSLPVDKRVLDVAKGQNKSFITDASISGTDVRVMTVPVANSVTGQHFAQQVAQDVSSVSHTLRRITIFLLAIDAGGIAIAVALGLLVSRAALAPVRRLTRTTEHVTETRDLASRIDTQGTDELSRLATSFNTMLAALEQSVDAQRQLVADASHELRTPLTSLRTNVEVLSREGDKLPHEERERLLADVGEQLAEMSALVAELVELARGEQVAHEPEDVRLDLLVEHAVERAQRNAPQIEFETKLEESVVHGVPASIERAVANLLDNAAKWSPVGGTVDVTVGGSTVLVRDRGPGIDETDLPHVFDRFYRAPSARGRPGSGLGLAIVKQVAEAHGGTVRAQRADGGGTVIELELDGAGAA